MNRTRNSRLWLQHIVKKVSAFIVPPTCSLTKITAQCCSQCIVNSYVQARICLQSLNGQRAMPTNIQSATYNIPLIAPRASWRTCQLAICVHASWRHLFCPSLIVICHSTVAATAMLTVQKLLFAARRIHPYVKHARATTT